MQKFMSLFDKIKPLNERQVKQNSAKWLHRDIVNEIENLGKLFLKNQSYTLTKIFLIW